MSLAQAFGLGGDRYSRELDEIDILMAFRKELRGVHCKYICDKGSVTVDGGLILSGHFLRRNNCTPL